MNANDIINDSMTLEEKLAAIDAAVAKAQPKYEGTNIRIPNQMVDPAELTMCEGCQ